MSAYSIRFRQSIQFKMGVTLVLLTTTLLSVYGTYQYFTLRSASLARLNALSESVMGRLCSNLATPIWDVNFPLIQEIVLAEMHDRNVLTILVRDAKERVLIGKGRDAQWQIVDTQDGLNGNFITSKDLIIKNDERLGTVTLSLTKQFMQSELRGIIKMLAVTILGLNAIMFFAMAMSLRHILIRPLVELLSGANAIANGDFSRELHIRQQDEIGALARAFHDMKTSLNDVLREMNDLIGAIQNGQLATRSDIGRFRGIWRDLMGGLNSMIEAFAMPLTVATNALDRLSKGDIPEVITHACKGDFKAIVTALNTMNRQLTRVVREVKASAETFANSSQALSSSAESLSRSASQQAAASQEASASMEQMTANIRQNADNARQTELLAKQSFAYAEEGGKVVAETVIAMQQIVSQISVIQDIAQQTRLLSLNATIEASRAQEYGKAFAVVAHEVRELANTTRIAAERIVEVASSSLEVSQRAGTMLSTLVPNIQKTAELVQEISAASAEQSSGADQVNQAIQQLDQVTQVHAATAEELAASAGMLAHQAAQLHQTMAFFTVSDTTLNDFAADAGLQEILRALAERGASDAALRALTESMAAAPSSAATAPSSASPAPQREMPVKSGGRDALDDEFERY